MPLLRLLFRGFNHFNLTKKTQLALFALFLFTSSTTILAYSEAESEEFISALEWYWEGNFASDEFRQYLKFSSQESLFINTINGVKFSKNTKSGYHFYNQILSNLDAINDPELNFRKFKLRESVLLDKLMYEINPLMDDLVSEYTSDYRKVSLKMELISLEFDQLASLQKVGSLSNDQLLRKIEFTNHFLRQVYRSGLINAQRKNQLTERFNLIEKMLILLAELKQSQATEELIMSLMKTSRMGESLNNKEAFRANNIQSDILRDLLEKVETLELQILKQKDLEEAMPTLVKRNELRNKYYAIMSDHFLYQEKLKEPSSLEDSEWRISFFVGNEWLIQLNEGAKTELVLHSKTKIQEHVSGIRKLLNRPNNVLNGRIGALDSLNTELQKLYTQILSNVDLTNAKRLNVDADGFLNTVPFEILIDDNDKYLFEVLEVIANTPYSEEFVVNTHLQHSLSVFDNDKLNLKGAQFEIDHIKSILKSRNNAFEFDRFQTNGIYHIASHQVLDEIQEPFIMRNDEEVISRQALFNFNVMPDVMVLSNCGSMIGRPTSGEGNASFANKSLELGSRAVLGSLWSIEDRASSQIMIDYYDGLLNDMNSRKSLITAKRQFLTSADAFNKNPFFWAAIVHLGDDFRLNTEKKQNVLPVLLFGVFLILFLTRNLNVSVRL